MVVMGIMIILTWIMAMDITDTPTTITVMRETTTIGLVMNGVNIMKVESVASIIDAS